MEGTGGANLLPGLQLDMLLMENQPPQSETNVVTACCVPSGGCLRGKELIYLNNNNNNNISIRNGCNGGANFYEDVVKVMCSNEGCAAGKFMHRECFEHWEEEVLGYLRSSGRARSWSEKQRHQNLWTKKGYDLAFRACGCSCARGYLKKDLDWSAAAAAAASAATNAAGPHCDVDKKKRKRRQNATVAARPTLAVSAAPFGHANGFSGAGAAVQRTPAAENVLTPVELRARTVSVSSSSNASNGSSSPPASCSQCSSNSPTTVPLPGVIGSGQKTKKKKQKTKKPDP